MYRSLFPTKQKMVVNVEAQIDIWRERWPLLELLPVHLSSAESSHDLFCCFVRYIDIWPSIHNDRSPALLSLYLFINKYCTFFIGIKYQHLPARCCPWYCCWWDQNVSWLILWIRIHYIFYYDFNFFNGVGNFFYVKSKIIYGGENYLRHTCFKVV